jgi:hypothetical protein
VFDLQLLLFDKAECAKPLADNVVGGLIDQRLPRWGCGQPARIDNRNANDSQCASDLNQSHATEVDSDSQSDVFENGSNTFRDS